MNFPEEVALKRKLRESVATFSQDILDRYNTLTNIDPQTTVAVVGAEQFLKLFWAEIFGLGEMEHSNELDLFFSKLDFYDLGSIYRVLSFSLVFMLDKEVFPGLLSGEKLRKNLFEVYMLDEQTQQFWKDSLSNDLIEGLRELLLFRIENTEHTAIFNELYLTDLVPRIAYTQTKAMRNFEEK